MIDGRIIDPIRIPGWGVRMLRSVGVHVRANQRAQGKDSLMGGSSNDAMAECEDIFICEASWKHEMILVLRG